MAAAPASGEKVKDNAQHSGRLLLRLPPALHSELAEAARRECKSLNAYITDALSASLSDDGTPAPRGPNRFMRVAVIVDLVMVAIATITMVVLVLAAWP